MVVINQSYQLLDITVKILNLLNYLFNYSDNSDKGCLLR